MHKTDSLACEKPISRIHFEIENQQHCSLTVPL